MPTSNVHSGAAPRSPSIPIGLLADLRFRVTVNTDNRLMSAITLTRAMAGLAEAFGWGWDDSGGHHQRDEERLPALRRAAELINQQIKPAYAALR